MNVPHTFCRFAIGPRGLVRLRRLWRGMKRRSPAAHDRIVAGCRGGVTAGPFRGMRYVERAVGSALPPKLLGTYERELHPWLEEIVQAGYGRIDVVGAAEGYYAVGLAVRVPGCRVRAYDLDPSSPRLLRLLAARNGVSDRVEFRGEFTAGSLADRADEPTLVLCDIEGAEVELLDPERMPELLRTDILVEVHDAGAGTMERVLRTRFAATHRIRRVVAAPRTLDDVRGPLPAFVRRRAVERAIDEGRRYGLSWLFMTRGRPGA